MSSEPIWIDELTISAFRGVRQKLSFSRECALDAPLTLLYAPNGTGKTTVCDAAEYLLTRDISRLQNKEDKRAEERRCSHSGDEVSTFVEADLTVGTESLYLKVSNDKDWVCGPNPDEATKSNVGEVLRKLAPEVADDSATGAHRRSHRKSWLQATRFLSRATLDQLVGSTEKDRSARKLTTADLFGTRHLQTVETKLSKLQDGLRPERNRRSEKVEELEGNLNDLRKEIESGDVSDSREALRRQAMEKLRTVVNKLEAIEFTASASDVRWEGALSDVRAQVVSLFEEKQAVVEQICSRIQEIVENVGDDISAWRETTAELMDSAESQAQDFERLKAQRRKLYDEKDSRSERMQKMDGRREELQSIQKRLNETRSELAEQAAAITSNSSLTRVDWEAQLRVDITEESELGDGQLAKLSWYRLVDATEDIPVGEDRLQTLHRLLNRSEAGRAERWKEIPDLEADIEAFDDNVSEIEIEPFRKDLEERCSDLEALQDEYETKAGHLDDLRLAIQEFVEHVNHDETCPVCTHRWESASELRAAIQEGLSEIPSELAGLKAELDAKSEEVEDRESLLESRKALKKKKKQIKERRESWRMFVSEAASQSTDLEEVDPTEVVDYLRARLDEVNLARIVRSAYRIKGNIEEQFPENDDPKWPNPRQSWPEWFTDVRGMVQEELTSIDKNLSSLSADIDELKSSIDEREQKIDGVGESLEKKTAELKRRFKKLDKARDRWQQITSEHELTSESLQTMRDSLPSRALVFG